MDFSRTNWAGTNKEFIYFLDKPSICTILRLIELWNRVLFDKTHSIHIINMKITYFFDHSVSETLKKKQILEM